MPQNGGSAHVPINLFTVRPDRVFRTAMSDAGQGRPAPALINVNVGRLARHDAHGGIVREGAAAMPWESIVMVTGVIVVFVTFAAVVAIVDRTTPRVDHPHPAE